MKLVKTPRRAATLKNSKQLHYEASGKAEVGAAFIFSLFTYLHSGAGDGTRPLVYTRLAVCQVSPTLLTTGSRYEAFVPFFLSTQRDHESQFLPAIQSPLKAEKPTI